MILPGNGEITLEALKKIADLVNQGISVYGTKARYSETFADIGKKKEYEALAHKLWGKETPSSGYRHYGKGTYTGECLWKKPSIKQVYNPTLKWSMLLSNRKKCVCTSPTKRCGRLFLK